MPGGNHQTKMKSRTLLGVFLIFLALMICSSRKIDSKNLSEEDQLILVGLGAFNDGFYDISEKQFSRLIKDYPTHGKVYDICYLLGKSLFVKGNWKEARSVFLKIANENRNFEFMDYTLFWLAEVEMKLGNGEEAKKFLLSLVKRFPKFEWLDYSYYLLGYLDFGSNKLAQAESSFKRLSSSSKNNELLRSSTFWLGIIAGKQQNHETAIRYLQTVVDDPRSVPPEYLKHALLSLGEAQFKLGRFNEAKLNYGAFYEQFKNDPLSPEVYWRLGFCEHRLGNVREAIQIFQSFKERIKESRLLLPTHYLLGELFLISGDYLSSIKELHSILNKWPEHTLSGAGFLTLFWNYRQLGEIDGASRVFQRLQKSGRFEDEKAFIQFLNAEITFREGRIPDSLPYFFNIVNSRFRERALFQIGRGYFFEEKSREAITNLDILLLEFPNSKYLEECLFIKGESLSKLADFDQALEAYNLIIRQNRSGPWRLFALTQAGTVYSLRNEHEKAENALKKIIEEFPNHPLAYHSAARLGNVYLKEKNVIEALYYFSMVLKSNILELLGEAHFGLGEAFYQQGNYEKALSSFESAMKHLKESSSWFFLAQLEIGNLQKRWGKYEEAKRSYTIILDQSKDDEMKRAAKELLSHLESHEKPR